MVTVVRILLLLSSLFIALHYIYVVAPLLDLDDLDPYEPSPSPRGSMTAFHHRHYSPSPRKVPTTTSGRRSLPSGGMRRGLSQSTSQLSPPRGAAKSRSLSAAPIRISGSNIDISGRGAGAGAAGVGSNVALDGKLLPLRRQDVTFLRQVT